MSGQQGQTQAKTGKSKPEGQAPAAKEGSEDRGSASESRSPDHASNLDQMLTKAVEVKGRIAAVQDDLRNVSADGDAAGGKVRVTCDGDGRMTDIRIDAEVAKGDPEILRELILTAVEQARSDARAQSNAKLRGAVEELPLPAAVTALIGQLLTLR